MKQYFLDANFLLRFLLKDNPGQYEIARNYLSEAKSGKIELILPSLIVAEMVYVLDRLYRFGRKEIVEKIGIIVNSPYIEIEERLCLQQTLLTYLNCKLHFADCYLLERSKAFGGEVLTFDKDFRKLK